MNQAVDDESWGISDARVYTMQDVTSFAVGARVNFGSGADVKVLSFEEKKNNTISVTSLFDQSVVVPPSYQLSKCETWTMARRECQQMGGDLAVVSNAKKNAEVTAFMNSYPITFFSGADAPGCTGPYPWIGGKNCQLPRYIMHKEGHECTSDDTSIGTGMSIQQCSDKCRTTSGCRFFIHGTGTKAGNCYHEKTISSSCSEGWEVDQYNFYENLEGSCDWVDGTKWSYTGPGYARDDPYLHLYRAQGNWGTWSGTGKARGICEIPETIKQVKTLDVDTLNVGEMWTSSQSRNGDIINTDGAYDVVSETVGGMEWIPAEFKSTEQYLPTPFGDKQGIQVMCAPQSDNDPSVDMGAMEFFDYDSNEESNSDTWPSRNGRPAGVRDCTTAFTGECSQRFRSGAYNVNFEWTNNMEAPQTHYDWILGNGANPMTTLNQRGPHGYAYWQWKVHPYVCMAYKMPPGTILNILMHVDGVGWRSLVMTQTKTPCSYPKGADFGQFKLDNKWHYTCVNIANEFRKYGVVGTGIINRFIYHNGGCAPYPNAASSSTPTFWIDDFSIGNQPLHLKLPTTIPPVELKPHMLHKNICVENCTLPQVTEPKLYEAPEVDVTNMIRNGAEFFDYDSMEEDSSVKDLWAPYNGWPTGTRDCETSWRGSCSAKFGQATWGKKTFEQEQQLHIKSLSNEDLYTAGVSGGRWSVERFPYMCMAYRMPEGTIVNMIAHIDAVGWRSMTMTQTKTPTSYPPCGDWGDFIQDDEWHFKCIHVYEQQRISRGRNCIGNNHISSILWHDGGGASYPGQKSGPHYWWMDDFVISSHNLARPERVPGHDVAGLLPLTVDQVGTLCVMSGILWSSYGNMYRSETMFYIPPECRWNYRSGELDFFFLLSTILY